MANGLYIHIPFCDGKCPYCGFYSEVPQKNIISDYKNALIKEVLNPKYKSASVFDTIYFGGGTPNLLGPDNLIEVIDASRKAFTFKTPEITIEINPCAKNLAEIFEVLQKSGLNRVSIGMQSANGDELDFLGRKHTKEDIKKAVSTAKDTQIANISLDLIIGLPNQTIKSLDKSIDLVLALDVTHISAYMLKIEPNTPFYKKNITVDDDDQANQYIHLCKRLNQNGFGHYEISSFAKKGFESRHNLKYWQGDDYLGLGPSAHSLINGKRFYYPSSIKEFISNPNTINDGDGGGYEEKAMLNLRLASGITGDIPKEYISRAKALESTGYVIADENGIRITESGFLLSNTLINKIING